MNTDTDRASIAKLATVIQSGTLSERDLTFACSLVQQYARRGYLSEKQWPCVRKLSGELTPVKVGDLSMLVTMFQAAGKHLKFPKFSVAHDAVASGHVRTYKFSLAKPDSKNPGFLYIKRDGTYIGKVSPASEFSRAGDCTDEDAQFVAAFSADPVGHAKAHGKMTSQCCFCNKGLDTKESMAVGYGPVCAKHYNLPWG